MPYFQDQDEQQKQEQEQLASGAAPVKLAGGASTSEESTSQGTSANQGGQQKSLDTGSGFQNLDKYLKANQGQNFGQQVAGKVQGTVDTAKQNQAGAAQEFSGRVDQASKTPTQDQINQAIANPNQDQGQFKDWMSQQYKGPQNLTSEGDLWNKYWSGTNQAQSAAKNLGTEGGRFALLDQYFGKPQYNFGQKSLDNLLVQRDAGMGQATQNLQNQAAQLKSQGNKQAKDLQDQASAAQGKVEKSRQAARAAVGIDDQGNIIQGQGALGGLQRDVMNQVGSENAARQAQRDQFLRDLQQGTLNADDARNLGVAGRPLYNVNLADYFSSGGDVSANQVMSPEQRARMQALSQLAGVQGFASDAPQAMTGAYRFDTNRLNQDVSNQENAYNRAASQILGQAATGIQGTDTLQQRLAQIKQGMEMDARQRAMGRTVNMSYNGLTPEQELARVQGQIDAINRLNDQYKVTNSYNSQQASLAGAGRPLAGTYR